MNQYNTQSLWLWLALTACQAPDKAETSHYDDPHSRAETSDAQPLEESKKATESENASYTGAEEPTDGVSAPVPVSGVFLTAQLLDEGQDYLVFGLRVFQDEQRFSQQKTGGELSWLVNSSADPKTGVSVEASKDPTYDSYLILKGAPSGDLKAELDQIALGVHIASPGTDKLSEAKTFILSEILVR